jgi:putative CocE/NonD family hydrolase
MLVHRPHSPSARPRRFAGLLFLLLAAAAPAPAQEVVDIRARYAKREEMVPMRDGVRLFTAIYPPKDAAQRYPIMLTRTPYSVGPYGPDAYRGSLGPSPRFAAEGFIFVYQDVRGCFMSEGEFVNMRPQLAAGQAGAPEAIDESTDTYDTIDWLVKNVPNNNGRVGIWGISYPGFYAAAGMIRSHPALKAASPQAPISDWFVGDDFHHNGAFFLFDAFNFFAGFGQPRAMPTTRFPPPFQYGTNDAYQFFLRLGPLPEANARYLHDRVGFWNDLMAHPNYDAFWQARSLPPHLEGIRAAVMTVGGWFDAEDLYGPLHVYAAAERRNPGIRNTLVMGPWSHGGWAGGTGASLGDVRFDSDTSTTYRNEVEFPFFNFYLKDRGPLEQPEARVFATGENRWLSFDAWPPRDLKPRSLYFHPGGRLASEPPAAAAGEFDEYLSDPARPVPYTNAIRMSRGVDYMIEDQRFAARRPDVLVYEGEPLAEDLRVAGPLTAHLFAATTGTDADFVVKLVDVYPDDAPETSPRGGTMGGFQMLVRGEVLRARFRDSFERPAPFKPGEVTPVKLALQDVCHTFRKGHRVMVQVQSSWFPLVDRNPQQFVDIYRASAADFRPATHRLYHTPRYPSHLAIGVRGG